MPKKKSITRKRKTDLQVEISFMEGINRRIPGWREALLVLRADYCELGKLNECRRADEQLTRIDPKDPHAWYNLACSQSLVGDFSGSLKSLIRAFNRGFDDTKRMFRDPHLASLRKRKEFKAALKLWQKKTLRV